MLPGLNCMEHDQVYLIEYQNCFPEAGAYIQLSVVFKVSMTLYAVRDSSGQVCFYEVWS